MQKLLSLALILVLSITVAACGGRKSKVQEGQVKTEDTGSMTDGSETSGLDGTSGIVTGTDGGPQDLGDPNSPLNKRVVYFEYDSSILTSESQAVVEAHAGWMQNNLVTNVIFEGHADERGTREYNLALGEDRSKSVARLMQALGITTDRMQSISYGEERPVALGGDEASWGLNRRVEFLYGQ